MLMRRCCFLLRPCDMKMRLFFRIHARTMGRSKSKYLRKTLTSKSHISDCTYTFLQLLAVNVITKESKTFLEIF